LIKSYEEVFIIYFHNILDSFTCVYTTVLLLINRTLFIHEYFII